MVKFRVQQRDESEGEEIFARLLEKAEKGYCEDDEDDFKWADWLNNGGEIQPFPHKEKMKELVKHGRMARELYCKGSCHNWHSNPWAEGWGKYLLPWMTKNI